MKTLKNTLKLLKKNLSSILLFELFYTLLGDFLFKPLSKLLLGLSLDANGANYISNANFLRYVGNPLTIIIYIVLIILISLFIGYQISSLLYAINASYHDQKVSFWDINRGGLLNATKLIKPKNIFILLFILIVLPFTDVIRVSDFFSTLSIPGFIMETINEFWYLRLSLNIIVIVLSVLVFKWFFTLNYFNFENIDAKTARKRANNLISHNLIKTILKYLGISLLLGLIVVGLFVGITALLYFSIDALWGAALGKVVTVSIMSVLVTIALLLLQIVNVPFNFALMSQLFYDLKIKKNEEIVPFKPFEKEKNSDKYVKRVAIASLLIAIVVSVYTSFINPQIDNSTFNSKPVVMAHRGDSVNAPENTLPAFQKAIDDGADASEMDVQMTKDGVIVVLHDDGISRTTGVNKKIWEVTYDEIKDLDNGSFFSPEYKDTHIPTLEELIQLVDGKLNLNIEIKRTGHDEGIEEKVVAIIQKYNFYNQCDITSMDYNTVARVRELDPKITTVYTSTVAYGDIEKLNAADAFSIEGTFVNKDLVDRLHKKGIMIYVWTIDDENMMQKMIDLDVDAIITNDPVLCKEIVNNDLYVEQDLTETLINLFTGGKADETE